jgi:plasmid maintenance system killer protein
MEKKFTDDELKQVKEIQQTYVDIQQNFGQVAVNRLTLLQQLEGLEKYEDELAKNFESNQKKEQELLETITKKYGKGTLDPKTGVFNTTA